ncbi:MAG TPA: ElyC/SanA/YdcF family protein [Candidatus Saccharimonadales bacterium]
MQLLKRLLNRLAGCLKRHRLAAGLSVIIILAILFGPITYTFFSTRGDRHDLDRTPISKIAFHHVALVFGAGILPDGRPTPYLQYRVETAVKLYKAHRVDILLMSGDNSVNYHNEPLVMKNYAVKLGVPAKAIVVDDAGFNTYDSCYRAHAIFGLHDATLVSQGYHLPRAMVTCRALGVTNTGVIAVHPTQDYALNYLARELVSTDKMAIQLVFKPNPTLLGKPLTIH